tara:strand:- start:843 stop:989 length:147 start_codon:yes stop_codon:yes gene_type:complete
MKKLYKKLENFVLTIWVIPAFRYFVIALMIALIIGFITGRSPIYRIFE